MARRIDFSTNAPIYDSRHGSVLAQDLLQRLLHAGGLCQGARVLDIGAGTGRVSSAFAQAGCDVLALDPSISMLTALRSKCAGLHFRIAAAEGVRLPVPSQSVDAIVLARVLYLMSDWREVLVEAHRVLKAGGVLFHEWGNGDDDEPWVQVRERLRMLFQESGVENAFHPGARSEAEVDSYLGELGFACKERIMDGPGPSMTLGYFLNKIENGEFSYIWNVPESVQEACLARLRRWCETTFDIDESMPMPKLIHWAVYQSGGNRTVRQDY